MTSSAPGQDGQTAQPSNVTNLANDYANVGIQAGVVNGNVHVYEVRGKRLADKYRVALNCLDGNMPRRAEELIGEAVDDGFMSNLGAEFTCNHVAYHWELAILSGRSFDHLGPQEFASVQRAARISEPDQADEWAPALQVVNQLVNCLVRQEGLGSPDPAGFNAEFNQVLSAYERLEKPRRDEIHRHLDMILVGGIQDQLDAIFAKEVHAQRMSADRENRVWKFFEQVPERPRAKAVQAPMLLGGERVMAICGGALAAAGFVTSLYLIAGMSQLKAAIVVLLVSAGCFAAVRFGIARSSATARLADAMRARGEHSPVTRYSVTDPARSLHEPYEYGRDDENGAGETRKARTKRAEFRWLLRDYVEYRFKQEAKAGQRWAADTARIGAALANELIGLYDDPPTEPGAINWLVDWRVKRIVESWQAGGSATYRDRSRVPARIRAGYAAGLTALSVGALMALVSVFQAQVAGALIAVALGVVGCWLLRSSRLDVYLVLRHRRPADQAEIEQRRQDEEREYQRWQEVLADRPSDAEMARWLDYDKMYVKMLAMNQYGLVNRDLIAHAVLTGAGDWRKRARVVNAPWRYSAYIVSLFLLTAAGVRLVIVDLEFGTGLVSNQRRINFRYDAIAEARVAELGIRFDGGRRQIILLDENDRKLKEQGGALILTQGFWLSFVNGRVITVNVENFDDGLIDRMREDPQRLSELALDASGVTGALRILEAIAAEGKEWIAQERARRSRRLIDFQKSLSAPAVLTEAPGDVTHQVQGPVNGDGSGTSTVGVTPGIQDPVEDHARLAIPPLGSPAPESEL